MGDINNNANENNSDSGNVEEESTVTEYPSELEQFGDIEKVYNHFISGEWNNSDYDTDDYLVIYNSLDESLYQYLDEKGEEQTDIRIGYNYKVDSLDDKIIELSISKDMTDSCIKGYQIRLITQTNFEAKCISVESKDVGKNSLWGYLQLLFTDFTITDYPAVLDKFGTVDKVYGHKIEGQLVLTTEINDYILYDCVAVYSSFDSCLYEYIKEKGEAADRQWGDCDYKATSDSKVIEFSIFEDLNDTSKKSYDIRLIDQTTGDIKRIGISDEKLGQEDLWDYLQQLFVQQNN